ncbi:MAG: hypothetical protein NTY64_13405 [Deltaproteobacteria bacterium]|nr:hypothetical protein [Deltaproteobacteria bacterium]
MASQKVHLRGCASPSSLWKVGAARRAARDRATRRVAPTIGFARRVPRPRESFLRSHLFGDFLRDHQLSLILIFLISRPPHFSSFVPSSPHLLISYPSPLLSLFQ